MPSVVAGHDQSTVNPTSSTGITHVELSTAVMKVPSYPAPALRELVRYELRAEMH